MIRMGTIGYRVYHALADGDSCCSALCAKLIECCGLRSDTSVVRDISSAHRCGKHAVREGLSCNGNRAAKVWVIVFHFCFLLFFKSVKYPIFFYSNSIPGRKCSFLPIVLAMNPTRRLLRWFPRGHRSAHAPGRTKRQRQ